MTATRKIYTMNMNKKKRYDVILDPNHTNITVRNKPEKNHDSSFGLKLSNLNGSIGFDFALPLIFGVLFGAYLDNKYGSHPKFTLILFGIGFLLSLASFIKTLKKEIHKH